MLDAIQNDWGTMEIAFTSGGFANVDANRVEIVGGDFVFTSSGGAVTARHPWSEVRSLDMGPIEPADRPSVVAAGESKTYSVEEIRLAHPQAYAPWTEREERMLLVLADGGVPPEEIASVLGRQIGGVTSRLKKLREADEQSDTGLVRFE